MCYVCSYIEYKRGITDPCMVFFMHSQLLTGGAIYEDETSTILLFLRCPFQWYHFLPRSPCLAENHGIQSGVLTEIEIFVVLLLLSGKCYMYNHVYIQS